MKKLILSALVASLFAASGCVPQFDDRRDRAASDRDVSVLSPDLPDSTSTHSTLRIDIGIGEPASDIYVPTPPELVKPETADTTVQTVRNWLVTAGDSGYYNAELFVDTEWINDQREFNNVSRTISGINADLVWQQYQDGKRIRFYPPGASDNPDEAGYELVEAFRPVVHGVATIFLEEHYTLSNFVGDYGTGRIANTFSLLPGETAELRVSTYRDESLATRSAASILDSSSQESFDSFVESLSDETIVDSIDRTSSSTIKVHATGGAVPGFAAGSARADANSSSNQRRDFHRAMSSSVRRTASQASSSRDVHIDTSVETTVEQGREDVSVRTVSNINTGHTLNFISYQMNQQYHSILHLTGVDVGFDDGRGNVYVFPLHQLDRLLDTFVIDGKRDDVRKRVVAEISTITDYKDATHDDFIRELQTSFSASSGGGESGGNTVYRVNFDYESEYDVATGSVPVRVPGIIVDVQSVIMRTDGVYVEALVGQNSAWDHYTEQLKATELRE